jgi:hypothetical protein
VSSSSSLIESDSVVSSLKTAEADPEQSTALAEALNAGTNVDGDCINKDALVAVEEGVSGMRALHMTGRPNDCKMNSERNFVYSLNYDCKMNSGRNFVYSLNFLVYS